MPEYTVHLPKPHPKQEAFIHCGKKRIVCRAGRRSGKTVGVSLLAVEQFLKGQRILYGAPTSEQVNRFWVTVTRALEAPIRAGIFKKNETDRFVERVGTEQRIRAKTCWNANTLRGDYCSLLILDEWQLMAEETWEVVGAPMLLDNDGDAVFIYTPPSLHSTGVSKAEDPRHAAKLFKSAKSDTTGRWAAFHFTSHDNPHISASALIDIIKDMTQLAYEQEILAEDKDEAPGALWHHEMIDKLRVIEAPQLVRVVVGVDPPGGSTECGIVVMGKGVDGHGYVLADRSLQASPNEWATEVVKAYKEFRADRVVAETNYGGDMVESTLRNVEGGQRLSYKSVIATRGKAIRAEPIAALYERGMIYHVGPFPHLEDQMCNWAPGDKKSPDRLDACLVKGTPITTQRGEIPIEEVTTEDHVWTRAGWKRVLVSALTNASAPVQTVTFSNGASLTGTGNHPVFIVGKGFVSLNTLVFADRIVTCKNEKLLSFQALLTQDFPTTPSDIGGFIFRPRARAGKGSTIGTFGHHIMAQFLKGGIFITRITIPLITTLITWYVLRRQNTLRSIRKWWECQILILRGFVRLLQRGIDHQRGMRGIKNMGLSHGKIESLFRTFATSVKKLTRPFFLPAHAPIFAASSVFMRQRIKITDTTNSIRVQFVEPFSGEENTLTSKRQPAPVHVVSNTVGGNAAVYNLTVEEQPEYFANGVLVHNCVWAATELDIVIDTKVVYETLAKRASASTGRGAY